jgi:branched-chain amino acid transport system permease protein
MSDQAVSTILVGTLVDAATLSLISAGFVVLYRATRVVSFAQGALMVLGTLLFSRMVNAGLNLYASLALAAVITGIVSAVAFRLILARLIGVSGFLTAMSTIGLATAALAICVLVAGDNLIALTKSQLSFHVNEFIGLKITQVDVFTIVLAVVVFIVLFAGIQWSRTGLRMRAVADNPTLAAYSGVATGRISMLAWGIAGATAALSGSAYTLVNQPTPDTLYALGLAAFPAILLGGLDSLTGAIVGSLVLALAQNVTIYNVSGAWEDVVSYGLLLIVLLLRPQGLFGSPEVRRL